MSNGKVVSEIRQIPLSTAALCLAEEGGGLRSADLQTSETSELAREGNKKVGNFVATRAPHIGK